MTDQTPPTPTVGQSADRAKTPTKAAQRMLLAAIILLLVSLAFCLGTNDIVTSSAVAGAGIVVGIMAISAMVDEKNVTSNEQVSPDESRRAFKRDILDVASYSAAGLAVVMVAASVITLNQSDEITAGAVILLTSVALAILATTLRILRHMV